MKRNLLTIMFVFSFVFFGLLITSVKAVNGSMSNITKSQISKSQLVTKFNKDISKIKKRCITNMCDVMIEVSAAVFDQMIKACNNHENSQACEDAQDYVQFVQDETLKQCSIDGPTAKLLHKKDFSIRSKQLIDTETLGR